MDTRNLSKMDKIEIAILKELKKGPEIKCLGQILSVSDVKSQSKNNLCNFKPDGINMDSLEDCVGATLLGSFELSVVDGDDGFNCSSYSLTVDADLKYSGGDYTAKIQNPVIAVKKNAL